MIMEIPSRAELGFCGWHITRKGNRIATSPGGFAKMEEFGTLYIND
jgi:hypothetical protein